MRARASMGACGLLTKRTPRLPANGAKAAFVGTITRAQMHVADYAWKDRFVAAVADAQ